MHETLGFVHVVENVIIKIEGDEPAPWGPLEAGYSLVCIKYEDIWFNKGGWESQLEAALGSLLETEGGQVIVVGDDGVTERLAGLAIAD
jgi:hypothetical protein